MNPFRIGHGLKRFISAFIAHAAAAAGASIAHLGAWGTDVIAEGQLDKASKGYFDLITVLLLSFQSLIEVIQIQKPEMLLHSLPSHRW